MPFGQKKICLLVCGELTGVDTDNIPELSIIAKVDSDTIFDQHSSNITPGTWQKLADEIRKRRNKYDGFVVFHNVDNVLYTAGAVSILNYDIKKPVIFTGGTTEARANIINSVQVSTTDIKDVSLMFGNITLKATHSSYTGDISMNKFSAPENAVLGQVDFGVRVLADVKSNLKIKTTPTLNDRVAIVTIQPGVTITVPPNKDAMIIKVGERQSLSKPVSDAIKKAAKEIPVVLWWPSCPEEASSAIIVANMTWPTTVAKLMWAAAQTKSTSKIKQILEANVAGELLS